MKLILAIHILILFNIQLIAQERDSTLKDDIRSQINFLASDEMKGRKNGSEEINISASYLADKFSSYNVMPIGDTEGYYQSVPLQKISKATKMSIKVGDSVYDRMIPITLFDNIDYASNMIFLDHGLKEDYDNKYVEGRVVIVKSGNGENNTPNSAFASVKEKQKLAKQKGAIGIIELLDADDDFFNAHSKRASAEKYQLQTSSVDSFFHLLVQDINNNFFDKNGDKKEYLVQVSVSGIQRHDFVGHNIVGIVEGSDPILKNEFIVFSAHYDHLGTNNNVEEKDSIYNGARDNAVGVVTILNTAKSFAIKPPKRSALFLLFMGEEIGLLGSKWYVDHPLIPLNKTVFCFNSDNAGYNDKSITTVVGLDRTSAKKNIITAAESNGLKAVDTAAEERALFYFSDNINFAKFGIPSVTFSMGFKSFDEEIYKYYHQVEDNPETLDYDYLEKFISTYVSAGRLISNDQTKVFWEADDEFYQLGQQLYYNNSKK